MILSGAIPLRLCIALLVAHTAFTGNRFIFTLHAASLAATPLQIGLLLSLMMAGPALLSVHFGRMADRVDYVRLCAFGLSMLFGASLLSVLASATGAGLAPLYAASLFTGSGYMLCYVAVNNALGRLTPLTHTAEAFSVLAMAMSFSGLVGPLASGLAIDHLGYATAYGAMACCAAASGALMVWAARHHPLAPHAGQRQAKGSFTELLREPRMRAVFIVSGVLAMGWDLFVFLAPLHGVRSGLSATAIAVVVAGFSIGTFVVRVALPLLVRRVSEWRILSVAGATTAAGFVGFPLLQGVWPLVAAAFVIGMGLGCAQPLSMALVYRTAPPHRVGEATGLRIAITAFSQSALPLLFGGLGAVVGLGAAFWFVSAALAGGAVLSEKQGRGQPGRR